MEGNVTFLNYWSSQKIITITVDILILLPSTHLGHLFNGLVKTVF